ncbi:aspartate kinase [Vibrio splendidus]|uniref:Aspartokinase n=2 Tax=Vibrio splendidus TaxID=29497 RepID=A0A2N7EAZ6_VIBSP|nr:aspartate kinase [Vibrio splendidus]OEF25121.1 aspartate kinase [Vibrio splendidus 1S-124]OEF80757.1 aspartate kinase [Vibrio splendidus 1F-157]PMK10678.1 aspartate kinase [Vibrio sp. 10N.261.54.E10]CAK2971495.1 Aspartokinase [Vibrio crassostreae]
MKMPLIVQKFGGTSVGSIERIHHVAEKIIEAKNEGNQILVVVSAMSGETNRLVNLASQVDSVPNARELDVLLTAGEQVSMALLAMTLHKLGYEATSMTGYQAKIHTDSNHNNATIERIDTAPIRALLDDDQIVIVAGFQGVNAKGDITTLGRGGSDTTAVALAGALQAKECQIYTDVDGVYSCDPRVVKQSKKLDTLDFPSMEEMARRGAKVLHLPCVQHAWRHNVPLRVLSSFEEGEGTLIAGNDCLNDIAGIAIQRDMVRIECLNQDLPSLMSHCQLLGIEVCSVIEETERAALIIKPDISAKLKLVFAEKIRNSEYVSLLTVVGSRTQEIVVSSHGLLSEGEIDVQHHLLQQQSLTLVISPTQVDIAANILHNAYIVARETQGYLKKEVHFG